MATPFMTKSQYSLMDKLRDNKPLMLSELDQKKHAKPVRVAASLESKGWAFVNRTARWIAITEKGKEALARVDSMPRKPLYAGGTKPYYRRNVAKALPLALPAPEKVVDVAPEGTMPSACVVELRVHLTIPVMMVVDGTFDAQAVASQVANTITTRGVSGYLTGWTVDSVLAGSSLIYNQPPKGL